MITGVKTLLCVGAFLFAIPVLAADAGSLFKQNCAPCHGADGSANTPAGKSTHAKDLRSPEVQKKSDAELAKQIRDGKGPMPGFKSRFSEEDISGLVAFVRGLAKK